jgi:signal transduction histidine kinase
MAADSRFAQLVSLAAHDLLDPVATVWGFTRELERSGLDAPADRHLQMIKVATEQLADLLGQLITAASIEAGWYDPILTDVDSLEIAQRAAAELGEDRVQVSGEGAAVRVDPGTTPRAVAWLAGVALKYGGHESVSLSVRGRELELAPVGRTAEPVLLGSDLKELSPAVAAFHVQALGGSLEAEEERLLIRLPAYRRLAFLRD